MHFIISSKNDKVRQHKHRKKEYFLDFKSKHLIILKSEQFRNTERKVYGEI